MNKQDMFVAVHCLRKYVKPQYVFRATVRAAKGMIGPTTTPASD